MQLTKPHKVLVVDDQELNRDILGSILEDKYDVIYAVDGEDALACIRKNVDTLSLVMLDIFMPRIDGIEVLRRMKADEQMRTIPVIVLTADKSMELKALQLGAADFITKPFDVHEVISARVERIIELSEEHSLISAAEIDRSTHLYSRNFFFEYAERLFTYHPELHLDAIVIDIEHFHAINALHGRKFGDAVIHLIGEEIHEFLANTIGIGGHIEADKFDVYCVHKQDYTDLLTHLNEKLHEAYPHVNIRLRMGIRTYSEGEHPLNMFDHARAACDNVRGNYKRSWMLYDDDLQQREIMQQRLLNDMRVALSTHQFEVYYQPKYYIQSDPPRLSSAEALIRWRHPVLGMISPGLFIPLFEAKGVIGLIDEFVWKEAAKQVATWKETYGYTLPVSVNLSRADLFEPDLLPGLQTIVRDNGLDYKDLKLEITESAYTDNAKELLEVIASLREAGFEIEMDDFGSGYSSLNMLSTMPIDVLKMDMKFVRNIETNETDRRLVALIVDIAKYLRVPVVAEGVETEAQLNILRRMGCAFVQGYYFSRPLPAAEFEALIKKELQP